MLEVEPTAITSLSYLHVPRQCARQATQDSDDARDVHVRPLAVGGGGFNLEQALAHDEVDGFAL